MDEFLTIDLKTSYLSTIISLYSKMDNDSNIYYKLDDIILTKVLRFIKGTELGRTKYILEDNFWTIFKDMNKDSVKNLFNRILHDVEYPNTNKLVIENETNSNTSSRLKLL